MNAPIATRPAALPAIFLPGWGFGRGPLEHALAGTAWQTRDLPGADGQPPPANFDAAVAALLDHLPPRCLLGGWSLGGMLALACAAAAPERIAQLVLVATTPSFVRRADWADGRPPAELAAFAERIHKEGAALLPRFAGSFCRGDADPDVARHLLAHATRMPQAALEAGLVWLAEADLRPSLLHIVCPVTLIHGAADPLMPAGIATQLAARLPQARCHILPGKAHAPFAPDPSAFLKWLPTP
jgi:pimeloyl-[acyl-carrier protein] methyl ester esterase